MKNEIKIEKQISSIEAIVGYRFEEWQREYLKKHFQFLESSSGFSDENVPDSPRPVSNSPRNAGKNGEFGPTELR